MRIISQDRKHDLPYEQFAFIVREPFKMTSVDSSKTIIVAYSVHDPIETLTVGVYASEEEAKLVLSMMYRKYCEVKMIASGNGRTVPFDKPKVFIMPKEGIMNDG